MATTYNKRTGESLSQMELLPFTYGGKKVVWSGLSLADQSDEPSYTSSGGTGERRIANQKGPLNHLNRLLMGGIWMDYKAGKSGDTVAGMLSRTPAEIIAKGPRADICILINGGNDINSISDYDEATTVIEAMKTGTITQIQTLTAASVQTIVVSLPVNGLWYGNNYARWAQDLWEQWLQEYCTSVGVLFVSAGGQLARPESQPEKTVTVLTHVGRTATVTSAGHGYSSGDAIHISCPANLSYLTTPGGLEATNVTTDTFDLSYGSTPAFGLTLSASTIGTGRTATSAGAAFAITDVGKGIEAGTGVAVITAFTSATVVTVQITANFAGTSISSGTWSITPSGSGSGTMTCQRGTAISSLCADLNTHYNSAGARKLALMMYDVLKNVFPPVDRLSNSESDLYNWIGAGNTLDNPWQVNRGMMLGSGGTASGTPTPTGTIPAGWTLETVSGTPTSVTSSIVQYDDAGFDQYSWWQVAIVTASTETIVDLKMVITPPSTFAQNTAYTINSSWVKPSTPNGYWYVCVSSGTSHASTAPTYPTRLGEQFTSGTAVFECRLGYVPGVTEAYMMADYKIQYMTDQALVCNSFGIMDNVTTNKSISDFSDSTETEIPQFFVGERGRYQTPSAVIDSGATSLTVRNRLRVAPNSTLVMRLGRMSGRVKLV